MANKIIYRNKIKMNKYNYKSKRVATRYGIVVGIGMVLLLATMGIVLLRPTPTSNKNKKWSKFVASNKDNNLDSHLGENGGEWTWCTHLMKYGPNFDRGLANFLSGILRPASTLEFGCGIGLYINYIEQFTTNPNKDISKFIGIEPESMIDAGVFGSNPNFNAHQLAMNIFDTDADILHSLGEFDLVFSSEVAEHIPLKFHDQMYDFLVAKTKKFLVFGAARKGQGGTGHLRESMHEMAYWIQKFEDRGMIHLETLSERLRASCYNQWDKGQNSFIMANPEYYQQFGEERLTEMLAKLNDVSDIFPEFSKKYTKIKENQMCDAN